MEKSSKYQWKKHRVCHLLPSEINMECSKLPVEQRSEEEWQKTSPWPRGEKHQHWTQTHADKITLGNDIISNIGETNSLSKLLMSLNLTTMCYCVTFSSKSLKNTTFALTVMASNQPVSYPVYTGNSQTVHREHCPRSVKPEKHCSLHCLPEIHTTHFRNNDSANPTNTQTCWALFN